MPRKGQVIRTTCKIAGCPNPPHVYPSGARVPYCRDHIHLRKGKQRGKTNLTFPMETVLRRLRSALENDQPFVVLDPRTDRTLDDRTLVVLVDRDWIVSGSVSEPLYRITGRGLDILSQSEKTVQRRDGICFKCGVRPRHVNGSGKQESYCYECERERCNAKTQRGRRKTPTDPCAHCKHAPRHQYQPSGTWSRYSKTCDLMLRNQRARTSNRQLRELIRRGLAVPPICKVCNERPCALGENSVASWCSVCRPAEIRKYKVRRMYARIRPGAAA